MRKFYKTSLLILCLLGTDITFAQTEITFYTTKGNFVVRLYDTIQPITSGNFKTLVNSNFYDGVIFHRVINNFMIQGGDPTGLGNGGTGNPIPDEFDNRALNIQKSISMANSGPNTGESQFFINLVNNPHLNNKHAVFGITTTGFNIVQDIGKVPESGPPYNRPLTDVVMDSLRVTANYNVGINKIDAEKAGINIFPNPLNGESIISIRLTNDRLLTVSVHDQMGRMISTQQERFAAGQHMFKAEKMISNELPAGIYYLLITDGTSIASQKLVK